MLPFFRRTLSQRFREKRTKRNSRSYMNYPIIRLLKRADLPKMYLKWHLPLFVGSECLKLLNLTSAKSIALKLRFSSLIRKRVSCLTGMVLVAILKRSGLVYAVPFRLLTIVESPLVTLSPNTVSLPFVRNCLTSQLSNIFRGSRKPLLTGIVNLELVLSCRSCLMPQP